MQCIWRMKFGESSAQHVHARHHAAGALLHLQQSSTPPDVQRRGTGTNLSAHACWIRLVNSPKNVSHTSPGSVLRPCRCCSCGEGARGGAVASDSGGQTGGPLRCGNEGAEGGAPLAPSACSARLLFPACMHGVHSVSPSRAALSTVNRLLTDG
jgi:hypothetical protein